MTITFITPVADTSKAILQGNFESEGHASREPGKFGRKQEDAIAALLTQRNIEEAVHSAGIGTRTLLRWLKVPEFQTAYRQARRKAFGQARRAAPAGDFRGRHHASEVADRAQYACVRPGPGESPALLLASRLAAMGIERGPNESLAETTARAMGITVRELRAKLWVLAGSASYRY